MFIYKNRKGVVVFFLFLFLGAAYFTTQLRFVYNFERFFPQDDEAIDVYKTYIETFGQDDNFLFIGLQPPEGQSVLTRQSLAKVATLSKELNRVEGVVRSQALTDLQHVVISPLGLAARFPVLRRDDAETFSKDSVILLNDPVFGQRLLSADRQKTAIYLKTDSNDFIENRAMMQSVDSLLAMHWEGQHHLLGKAQFERSLVGLQIKEFVVSSAVSLLLVLLAFMLFFKSWQSTLIALISMVFCMVFFTGFMGLFGVPIDFISALYPVIIVIVGISDVVHISARYINEVRSGIGRERALRNTVKTIGWATFLTSLTTGIGFLSLLSSKLIPVRTFGVASAVGIVLAFGIVILFTTALLSFLPNAALREIELGKSLFSKLLERAHSLTQKHPKRIGLGFALVLLLCVHGIANISTDVEIGATLPRGEKVTEDYHFFEEHFVGFRPYELYIECLDSAGCEQYNTLAQINKIDAFIDSIPSLNRSFSLVDAYRLLNRARNGNRPSAYAFPSDEMGFKRLSRYARFIPPEVKKPMLSESKDITRISATVKDVGTDSIQAVNLALRNFLKEEIDSSIIQAKITGTGVLFDKNNEYLRINLIYGLGIAVLLIGVLMGLLFRDIRFLVISILPNMVPLLFGAAVMGWLGIQLEATTSMIFAITYGIAVDDTIHYLSKLNMELNKGRNVNEALRVTTMQAGRPIIVTSLILFFGFLILLFSKTPAVFYVGLLISITLFTAVISDVFLIPVLCRWILPSDEEEQSVAS